MFETLRNQNFMSVGVRIHTGCFVVFITHRLRVITLTNIHKLLVHDIHFKMFEIFSCQNHMALTENNYLQAWCNTYYIQSSKTSNIPIVQKDTWNVWVSSENYFLYGECIKESRHIQKAKAGRISVGHVRLLDPKQACNRFCCWLYL